MCFAAVAAQDSRPASAARAERFFAWIKQQQLYYSDITAKDAQGKIDGWLERAPAKDRRDFLDGVRSSDVSVILTPRCAACGGHALCQLTRNATSSRPAPVFRSLWASANPTGKLSVSHLHYRPPKPGIVMPGDPPRWATAECTNNRKCAAGHHTAVHPIPYTTLWSQPQYLMSPPPSAAQAVRGQLEHEALGAEEEYRRHHPPSRRHRPAHHGGGDVGHSLDDRPGRRDSHPPRGVHPGSGGGLHSGLRGLVIAAWRCG